MIFHPQFLMRSCERAKLTVRQITVRHRKRETIKFGKTFKFDTVIPKGQFKTLTSWIVFLVICLPSYMHHSYICVSSRSFAVSCHFQALFLHFNYILSHCFLSVIILMHPFCLSALWLSSPFLFVITFLHLFFVFIICALVIIENYDFSRFKIKVEWMKLLEKSRKLACLA